MTYNIKGLTENELAAVRVALRRTIRASHTDEVLDSDCTRDYFRAALAKATLADGKPKWAPLPAGYPFHE